MKKTLIALAAAAATGVFAQSSVTLTGLLDTAGVSKTGNTTGANGTSITTGVGTSSTTNIKLTAIEDLGGGMKVTAQFELDPRTLFDDNFGNNWGKNDADQSSNSATSQHVKNTLTGLGRHEVFLGISGGFGNVQLGSPNSFALAATGASSPLGTGIGAGYTVNGASGTGWNRMMETRYNRAVKYTSPNVNGFTVGVQYAPGNDQTQTLTSVLSIPNNRNATEIGVSYSAGNLNVAYANFQQKAQDNVVGFYGTGGVASAASTNFNVLGVNYKFGNLTAYAGWGRGDKKAAATAPATQANSRMALKYTMGNVDVIGQMTQLEAAGVTEKVNGARIDYNLSKTAAAYIGFEQYDNGAASSTTLNLTSVGLRKSF